MKYFGHILFPSHFPINIEIYFISISRLIELINIGLILQLNKNPNNVIQSTGLTILIYYYIMAFFASWIFIKNIDS